MTDIQNSLPPGWDSKFDPKTNRYYFINHYTRMTTWEDPRSRYKQIHGTPTNIPSMQGEVIPLQEFNSVPKLSPIATKITHAITATKPSPSFGRASETSLTTVQDTEQSVSKISTMFPTVSETHIRLLLKKYYNREAVVISALQVEKHPITTPGPFTTPPPTRSLANQHAPFTMTPPATMRNGSRIGSPITRVASTSGSPSLIGDYRCSPKPHSSPKMKLRYMKSIFPKVEETIILDVLGNNDNNVQKASEALKLMGFEKTDVKLAKKTTTKPEQSKAPEPEKPKEVVVPKMKTLQEKNKMKSTLQEKYKDVPERVIVIALESVDFDENKAKQILEIMVKEETSNSSKSSKEASPEKDEENKIEASSKSTLAIAQTPMNKSIEKLTDKQDTNKSRRIKEKINSYRNCGKVPSQESSYTSVYLMPTQGPNPSNVKGSDDGMLLEDYMTWDGPDPSLRQNQRILAKGPNSSLLTKRTYEPRGPNTTLCRGPALGLAKGSIYSQLKSAVVGESRGK